MCETLGQLRDAMSRAAASFDASLLSAAQAAVAVREAAAIERMAATLKGLAAVRSAATGAWKEAGDRSAAHHLARTTGTSLGQATEVIETAQRLENLPAVAAAARSGRLSAQQAAAVAAAATADASAEGRLLDKRPGPLWASCATSAPAPRRRPSPMPTLAVGPSTPAVTCGATPTPRAPGRRRHQG